MEPDLLKPIDTKTTTNASTPVQKSDILKPLRTYERDIADLVRAHQVSTVQINIAEQKKVEKLPEPEKKQIQKERQEERKELLQKTEVVTRNSIFSILSIILIIIGASVFVLFFINKPNSITTNTTNPELITSIPSDLEYGIVLDISTQPQLAKQFSDLVQSTKDNSLTHVKFLVGTINNVKEASPETFFRATAPNIPASLTRALNTTMFAGIYANNDKHPFFIISVDTFDKAFEGMLEWEKNMYQDFGIFVRTNKTNSSVAFGTPPFVFEDEIIQNKDTRILKNNQGEVVMIYSFIDEQTLFIVDNEETFKEILNRFSSAKFVR